MSELSENAKQIFETLYSKPDETIEETFRRVARRFATTEREEELAFELQDLNIWRANTPVYFNSSNGKHNRFLASACWVVPLDDSMSGIYDVANIARKIFGYGAGIGIPIGNLREKDAPIYGENRERSAAHCHAHSDATGYESSHEYVK